VELVIWPETALPDDVRNSENSYALVYGLCTNGPPILTGSLDSAALDTGETQYFNSAFLFDAEGRIVGEYDKRHLVIGGEFIPLARFVPWRWQVAWGWPASICPARPERFSARGGPTCRCRTLICSKTSCRRWLGPTCARDRGCW
jgi:predicted amidohydrolase